ncbi:MAG: flagellar assembly protein FliW [Nitrospirae bacterium]|nr:flagellar assembly protein FliW [Nitrospirota bacterium]MBF0533539.1 flagellar assembly protein FliW [Nitrospirota bacterium]MBF0615937.1 flagellar assembly protein FliW [Nitrospirota bacterium]
MSLDKIEENSPDSDTIRIVTTRFGTIELESSKVISFPEGILGFPDLKRYVLMDYKDTEIKWLQAVDDPDIAFIVTDPAVLMPGFSIVLDPMTKKFLDLENTEDLLVLVIIRVENGKVIANFLGPLIFNATLMRGVQVVLDKDITGTATKSRFS